MRFKSLITAVVAVFMLSGCMGGAPQIDPMAYQVMPSDTQRVVIPPTCKSMYESTIPKVAIVEFANNTTYGKMAAVNVNATGKSDTTRKHVSGGVVGFVPGAVGYVHGSKTNVQRNWSTNVDTFMREVAPNIGEYAQSAVEDTITNIGGLDVYNRANLEKVMKEQQFQMVAADPDTAVSLGKLAGVQYIITGTVDNIDTKYIPPVKDVPQSKDSGTQLALLLGQVAVNTQTGWNVNIEMTVKMIDVETGKAVISKKVKGREVAGKQEGFNPEMVITAAKKAMGEAVDDIKPDFSGKFALQGYITQLKGNKQVAMISIGSSKGLKPGEKLEAYDFSEIIDPMTNASVCSKSKVPVILTVSNQVDENYCWVTIEADKKFAGAVERLRTGTLIKRAQLDGQSIFKKMF